MSRVCSVTGSRPSVGSKVSHSNIKTKRRYLPNMIKKKVFNPATCKVETMKLSAKGLKTIQKQMRK